MSLLSSIFGILKKMENKEELKQYYADFRKGIGLEKEDEKNSENI